MEEKRGIGTNWDRALQEKTVQEIEDLITLGRRLLKEADTIAEIMEKVVGPTLQPGVTSCDTKSVGSLERLRYTLVATLRALGTLYGMAQRLEEIVGQ